MAEERERERGKEEGIRLRIGVSLHDLVKTWFDIVERQLREGCIARNRIAVGSCASEVEDGRGERR